MLKKSTAKKSKKIAKKIVMVSGGFDPVHIGHVRMFREAKKLGDELVVVLNNDNWLKAKKGYFFMPEKQRKEIIEAIKYVDRVVLTEHKPGTKEMGVMSALKKLKPNIFAKSGDRNAGNIPEYEFCKKMKIEIVFGVTPHAPVHSSELVKNALKNFSNIQKK